MLNVGMILKIGCYILIIVFGTHFIRTVAFNRYEAVTYEAASISLLISILLMWKSGFASQYVLFTLVMLAAFIGIAFSQYHFYMLLQNNIEKAFMSKSTFLKKKRKDDFVNGVLLTMASVAVMPSFSTFIEESKMFNNPGGFIGLVKSIMKRQRFQKKKYAMRECFAENVNLIGPCKPGIDDMVNDTKVVIPGAIHAKDLALDVSDEKKGLFLFDFLGFGALIAVFVFLYVVYSNMGLNDYNGHSIIRLFYLCILVVLFVGVSHFLRHMAFARYESVSYEFVFTALVIVSFGFFDSFISGQRISTYSCSVLVLGILLFFISSISNKSVDKKLHNRINDIIDNKLIYCISPEYETDRIKRRFLQNLKLICEWAVVPITKKKKSFIFEKFMITKKMKQFEEINMRKWDIPHMVSKLINTIVDDSKLSVTPDDLMLSKEEIRKTLIIVRVTALAGTVISIMSYGLGML